METVINEHNELIATIVPPGDRWKLVADPKKQVYPTLTETLEVIELAKKNDFSTIISHRSGDTEYIAQQNSVSLFQYSHQSIRLEGERTSLPHHQLSS